MGRLFVAVPVTIAALATAVVVTPAIGDALGEREWRRNAAEYERLVAPARDALRGLRADGLTPCRLAEVVDGACLGGKADVRVAAASTEKALRAVGATDVVSRCRDSRTATVTVCQITARLHGADVHGVAGPEWVAKKPTDRVKVTLLATYNRA